MKIVIIGNYKENMIYLYNHCNCNMIYAALIGNYENYKIKSL